MGFLRNMFSPEQGPKPGPEISLSSTEMQKLKEMEILVDRLRTTKGDRAVEEKDLTDELLSILENYLIEGQRVGNIKMHISSFETAKGGDDYNQYTQARLKMEEYKTKLAEMGYYILEEKVGESGETRH